MSSSWIINHDGLIIDFKDTTEGMLTSIIGDRTYFRKVKDNEWQVITFSSYELKDAEVLAKINYVQSKAGGQKVSKYFMELLSKEFPSNEKLPYDDEQMRNLFEDHVRYLSYNIKIEGEKYVYVSGYESVIVDGKKYTVGQTVHFNGHKYIVKKDSNNEGYLDLVKYPTSKGFIVTEEVRRTREEVHYIDYTASSANSQFAGTDVFFDYTNGQIDPNNYGTIISNNKSVERRLRASKLSEIRYWECVDFIPGHKSKTVESPTGKHKIKKEEIGSRK